MISSVVVCREYSSVDEDEALDEIEKDPVAVRLCDKDTVLLVDSEVDRDSVHVCDEDMVEEEELDIVELVVKHIVALQERLSLCVRPNVSLGVRPNDLL